VLSGIIDFFETKGEIMSPKHSIIKRFIVQTSQIHLLCSIVEAYEGIATITTLQSDIGLIQLNMAPGWEEEIDLILKAEKEHLNLRAVSSPASQQNP
jgi:hypothetical protein